MLPFGQSDDIGQPNDGVVPRLNTREDMMQASPIFYRLQVVCVGVSNDNFCLCPPRPGHLVCLLKCSGKEKKLKGEMIPVMALVINLFHQLKLHSDRDGEKFVGRGRYPGPDSSKGDSIRHNYDPLSGYI